MRKVVALPLPAAGCRPVRIAGALQNGWIRSFWQNRRLIERLLAAVVVRAVPRLLSGQSDHAAAEDDLPLLGGLEDLRSREAVDDRDELAATAGAASLAAHRSTSIQPPPSVFHRRTRTSSPVPGSRRYSDGQVIGLPMMAASSLPPSMTRMAT